MKIVALGTSQFLMSCVKGFLDSGHDVICLVSEPERLLPVNSINIKDVAAQMGIDYLESEDINSRDTCRHLRALQPDIIFSAWPRIIGESVLSIPRLGVIGSHPTPLPFNRGRHPLHWQIVLGLRESVLTLFLMDKGIDSGQILMQVPYSMGATETIKVVSDRLCEVAYTACLSLGEKLSDEIGSIVGTVQDHRLSNTWRKRTPFDVMIDFRMTGNDILLLIRSFSAPFSGALILDRDAVYRVVDGAIVTSVESALNPHFMEFGKIISVSGNRLRVKAADCILDLETKESLDIPLKSRQYFHPPSKYLYDNPSLGDLIT